MAGMVGLLLCLAPGAQGQQYEPRMVVPVTFYDFRSDRSNPEFEQPHGKYNGSDRAARPNMVGDTLDLDGKPMYGSNPYLNYGIRFWFRNWSNLTGNMANQTRHGEARTYLTPFKPIYTYEGKNNAGWVAQPTSPNNRGNGNIQGEEWNANVRFESLDYSNAGSNAFENRVVPAELVFDLVPNSRGMYTFYNDAFFPLDGGITAANPLRGQVRFNQSQVGAAFPNEWNAVNDRVGNHNYSFTMEMACQFKMEGGLVFDFTGDDDVWVFVNGRRALDLGGIHNAVDGAVRLDDLRNTHGLIDGRTYELKMFYSERHSEASTIRITTNVITARLTGMEIKVDAGPMKAGEPKPAKADVSCDTCGTVPMKDFSKGNFIWTARDEGGYNTTANGTLKIEPAIPGAQLSKTDTIKVTAQKAYTYIWIIGEYYDSTSMSRVRDSVRVWVGPGDARQVSIEASQDSMASLRARADLTEVVISGGQTYNDAFYAILRDEFGNWVRTASASGGTIAWTELTPAIATVVRGGAVATTNPAYTPSHGTSRGQGKANRVSDDDGSTPFYVSYQIGTAAAFRDTSTIRLLNVTYTAIRVGVVVGGQFIQISNLDMVSGTDTTLWVEMRRSDDPTKWDRRPATWSASGAIPGIVAPTGTAQSMRVAPTGAGSGTITAAIPTAPDVRASVTVSVINRDAAAMRIFDKSGTPNFTGTISEYPKDAVAGTAKGYPTPTATVTVAAGTKLPLVAKMFSNATPSASSWLENFEGTGGGATWTWNFVPGTTAYGTVSTTSISGNTAEFVCTVAHNTYQIRAVFTLSGKPAIQQDIWIRVIPDILNQVLVIEPNNQGMMISPNAPQRVGNPLIMGESIDETDIYAVVRDRYGNYISPAGAPNPYLPGHVPVKTDWTSRDPSVVTTRDGAQNQGQGYVVKAVDGGGAPTWVVANNAGLKDSVRVQLLGYDYSEIIIVKKCSSGGFIIIDGQMYCDIDDIEMTTNDDETIYVVGKRNDDCGDKCYDAITGDWERDPGLGGALSTPPSGTPSWTLRPDDTGKGKIIVSRPGRPDQKDTINVVITVGPPLRAELELIPGDYKAGDPIKAIVKYYNRAGLMTEWNSAWTSDGAFFGDTLGNGGIDTLPRVVSNKNQEIKTLWYSGAGARVINATLKPGVSTGRDTVTFYIFYAAENHQIRYTETIMVGGQSYPVTALSDRFTVKAGDPAGIRIESQNLKPDGTLDITFGSPDELLHAVAEDKYGNRVGVVPSDWDSRSEDGGPVFVDRKESPILVYKPSEATRNGDGQVCANAGLNDLGQPMEDCITVRLTGYTIRASRVITRDYDGCGYLDAIELMFRKRINLSDSTASVMKNSNLMSGIIVRNGEARIMADSVTMRYTGADSSVAIIWLKESAHGGPLQTNWRPAVTIPDGVFDNAGFQAHTSSDVTDGAAPVIETAKLFLPSDVNVKNYIDVRFSEDVRTPNRMNFRDDPAYTPGELFRIWQPTDALAKSRSSRALAKKGSDPSTAISFRELTLEALDGITGISFVSDNTLRFSLENGYAISPSSRHYINIKAEGRAPRSTSNVWDASASYNVPDTLNRKVPVTWGNKPEDKAKAIPNPASPDASRTNGTAGTGQVRPGTIFATHDPTAIRDIQDGKGGTVVRISGLWVPNTGDIKCQIKVYDLAGNLVISGERDKVKRDLLEVASNSAGDWADLDIYWNGFNSKGMKVSPGTYRMVVYVSYTDVSGSNKDDSSNAKNKKYQTTVGMSK